MGQVASGPEGCQPNHASCFPEDSELCFLRSPEGRVQPPTDGPVILSPATTSEGSVCVPVTLEMCCVRWEGERGQIETPGPDSPVAAESIPSRRFPGVAVEETVAAPGSFRLARHKLFDPHMRYRFGDYYNTLWQIGEGSFGDVHVASAKSLDAGTGKPLAEADTAGGGGAAAHTARQVAVKVFSIDASTVLNTNGRRNDPGRAPRVVLRRQANFDAERAILAHLDHPHIVKVFECFVESRSLYIVLELCRGGELFEHIMREARRTGRGFDERRGRETFRQMLYAVCYLHSCRIIHRDIKTENFLVLGEMGTPQLSVVKLCDFGTAIQLLGNGRPMEKVGSPSYMAPEIYDKRGASVNADAWSLGVTLYVLLTGSNPFKPTGRESAREVERRIRIGNYDKFHMGWQQMSGDPQDLINRFIVPDETKRLTCADAVWHSWLLNDGRYQATDPRSASQFRLLPHVSPMQLAQQGQAFTAGAYAVISGIERFKALSSTQQLLIITCAQLVCEEDLIHGSNQPVPWYDLFVALDADRDGRLRHVEFVRGMQCFLETSHPVSDEKLEWLADAIDVDHSGYIDWVEWLVVVLMAEKSVTARLAPEPLNTVFRLIDKSSADGIISSTDLFSVLEETDSASGNHRANYISPGPSSYSLPGLRRLLESVDEI